MAHFGEYRVKSDVYIPNVEHVVLLTQCLDDFKRIIRQDMRLALLLSLLALLMAAQVRVFLTSNALTPLIGHLPGVTARPFQSLVGSSTLQAETYIGVGVIPADTALPRPPNPETDVKVPSPGLDNSLSSPADTNFRKYGDPIGAWGCEGATPLYGQVKNGKVWRSCHTATGDIVNNMPTTV